MAGRGTPPKTSGRRRSNEPTRGDWSASLQLGWQHGELPPPPARLMKASVTAWQTWFGSWFASHWSPSDIPALRQIIRLYDQVERGEFVRATELRLMMDTYGITPKGQQDRRWLRPLAPSAPSEKPEQPAPTPERPYRHLRAVNE